MLNEIIQRVKDANPERHASNLERRSMKLLEELGETAQAYLSVTSASNQKQKTWDDVREEIADCLIVSLDIAWTVLSGEDEVTVPAITTDPNSDLVSALFRAAYRLALYVHSLDMAYLARHEITQLINLIGTAAMIALPDQDDVDTTIIEARLLTEVDRKLAKWAVKRANMVVVTDDISDEYGDDLRAEFEQSARANITRHLEIERG